MTVGSLAQEAAAQESPTLGWAGWARCEIAVQGPGYRDQQTHTWTMSGGTPTAEGAFRIYAATWSAAGGGNLTRTTGTQTLKAEWATNVPATTAPLAVFVRASDGRVFIQARHAQLRGGAVEGYQQLTIDGKPQTPGKLASQAFEWAFPLIEASAQKEADTLKWSAVGSSTPPVTGSVGLMQPAGSQATASCRWQFARGSMPAPPAPVATQSVPTPETLPPAQTPAAPTLTVVPLNPALLPPPSATPSVSPPTPTAGPLNPALLSPVTATCNRRGPTVSYYRPPYISPKRVNVIFEGVDGATGYTVHRRDLGQLTPTPIAPKPTGNYMYEHDNAFRAPIDPSVTYVYIFRAHYPDGCGDTTLDVAAPAKPNMPRTDTPVVAGGKVTIRARVDDPHGDFTGIIVTGDFLPAAGQTLLSKGFVAWPVEFSIVGVPAGLRSWTFTSFYDIQGGRVVDMSNGRTVNVTVP